MPEWGSLVEELQRALGTKVKIVGQKKRGKIEIEYYSPEELDRIIELLRG
jgi:ParB family chromosome partitioning protein